MELRAFHVSSEFLNKFGLSYDFLGGLVGYKANFVSKVKRAAPGFCTIKRFD